MVGEVALSIFLSFCGRFGWLEKRDEKWEIEMDKGGFFRSICFLKCPNLALLGREGRVL